MNEIKDEMTMREPKLDELRWGMLAVRVHVDGTYDPRAARTTLHMLDEDVEELVAVEQCGVLADEPDVYKVFLVRFTVDDEFEGRAKAEIDKTFVTTSSITTTDPATGDVTVSAVEQPATATTTPKPSTPLTNVTPQHNQQQQQQPKNRGLRLENPKGESWRR